MILTVIPQDERDPQLDRGIEEFVRRYPGAHEIGHAMSVTWSVGRVTSTILVNGPDRLEATLVDGRVADVEVISDSDFEERVWCAWFGEVLG